MVYDRRSFFYRFYIYGRLSFKNNDLEYYIFAFISIFTLSNVYLFTGLSCAGTYFLLFLYNLVKSCNGDACACIWTWNCLNPRVWKNSSVPKLSRQYANKHINYATFSTFTINNNILPNGSAASRREERFFNCRFRVFLHCFTFTSCMQLKAVEGAQILFRDGCIWIQI